MDSRLLEFYNRELQHVREMGGEFAAEFPKIAGRLGLDAFECADPYVERLLEGFAFLAARIQLKLDAEFPRFTQHLLEMVYPNYLAPTPSMAVVQFQPDLSEGGLNEPFDIPRHSLLRGLLGKSDQTPVEYRTAHDVTLWPLELTEAEYLSRDLASLRIPDLPGVKAMLRFRFRATAGVSFHELPLDRLPIYLRGSDDRSMRIYEQLIGNTLAVVIRAPGQRWHTVQDEQPVRRHGFDEEQSLLPYGPRSYQGYRLLHEYFALPERFMFVELTGLQSSLRRCESSLIELIVLLRRHDRSLDNAVDSSNFSLFCSPAINLFPKRADRVQITGKHTELHILPDRTRPMDFEVYSVTGATAYGTSNDEVQEFLPFYTCRGRAGSGEQAAYFTVNRLPRVISSHQRTYGARSSYVGSEVFLSLVDAREAPYSTDLRQLTASTLCTNRDLPLHMPLGETRTDLTMAGSAPVEAVRCLAGPTKPRPSHVHAPGEIAWRLISQLSLNYLSLADTDVKKGAEALRDLLRLYGDSSEAHIAKQIEGIRSVKSKPVTRRLPAVGPITFGRGLEVTVECDESAFEGTGVFLLGTVLEEFFARYASINSFTQTVIRTTERGEVMRWPVRIGLRHTL